MLIAFVVVFSSNLSEPIRIMLNRKSELKRRCQPMTNLGWYKKNNMIGANRSLRVKEGIFGSTVEEEESWTRSTRVGSQSLTMKE